MVSVDKVHKVIKALSNTESIGNTKPESIDLFINQSVEEMYEELFFDVNRAVNRQNRGLINTGLESTVEKIREKQQHYLEIKVLQSGSGIFNLPTDLRYFDTLYYDKSIVELCKSYKEFLLSKENASFEYPIGLKASNTITIYPDVIKDIQITYLRNPIPAKWTYLNYNGAALFDPSKLDFRNIDIHPSAIDDLVIKVLNKLGINLKEKDIIAVTQREELREFNQESAN
ncbi:hypothetical protein [Tenacibaculum sp. 190524A02b]|uniref:hypothetical protein n=1 Tax=Tenacibaculum vairaonense TaxID=3137860 RepID=UPI0031FB875F